MTGSDFKRLAIMCWSIAGAVILGLIIGGLIGHFFLEPVPSCYC